MLRAGIAFVGEKMEAERTVWLSKINWVLQWIQIGDEVVSRGGEAV